MEVLIALPVEGEEDAFLQVGHSNLGDTQAVRFGIHGKVQQPVSGEVELEVVILMEGQTLQKGLRSGLQVHCPGLPVFRDQYTATS